MPHLFCLTFTIKTCSTTRLASRIDKTRAIYQHEVGRPDVIIPTFGMSYITRELRFMIKVSDLSRRIYTDSIFNIMIGDLSSV